MTFAIGLLAALLASVCFNVGIVVQALDAREAPREEGMRLTLIARLLKRRRWLLGLFVGFLGFPLQILAFADAPFVVVQPALAVGLLLLLALGVRMLGERVGPAEVSGVIAITVGIGLLAWGAPDHTEQHRSALDVTAVMAVLLVLTFVPYVARGRLREAAMPIILSSGLGFAAGNIASKLLSDNVNDRHWLAAALWLALIALTGVFAILGEMTSLQRAPATRAVPVSFGVQTFLPILLEPLFLRESFDSADFSGIPIVVGMLLMLFGILAVARTRAVSALAAGDLTGALQGERS